MLLGSASGLSLAPAAALAQSSQTEARPFDIPAQPLATALQRFMQQSGLQLSYPSDLTAGVSSRGVSGSMPAVEAIGQLLAGTGLTYRFVSPTAVTLERAPEASSGAVQLGTLRVEGTSGAGSAGSGGEGWTAETPFFTPAPTAHISAQTIERFRGSSPADIFRGTAGVMSGEARNSGSSIDVNIRGMQGFGRVVTTVDGAENAVTVYQGYQGVSNRTFVDPDFIGGVDITKGADMSAWGSAGTVSMRTLDGSDILKPGETWAVRARGSVTGNTSKPHTGDMAGYGLGTATLTESATGLDRPSFLKPTDGSFSFVGAARLDSLEIVAGYAWRKRGNYHAGSKGGDRVWADPVVGTNGRYVNDGYTNYRPGEEVLNTELETRSWLVKATAQFDEAHSFRLGYTGFRSEGGDILASRLSGSGGRATQAAQTAGTRLDTITARYRWKPSDNDLFDLTANAYWSYLELRNPIRGGRNRKPEQYGLPEDFRVGSDTDMWGLDVANLSKLTVGNGRLELSYGLSYRAEDTRGSRFTGPLEAWNVPRDAIRHEAAGFAKGSYTPDNLDWLTLNAGLRYSHYWSKDRYDPYEESQANFRPVGLRKNAGGFSPSAGITAAPVEGVQFYLSYSSMLRAPSVFESANAFNSAFGQEDLIPERSRNWEIGANLTSEGLVGDGDTALLKLGYFNWDVKDYISWVTGIPYNPGRILETINIHRARFAGLELSSHYGIGGFAADISANYFLNVEYCRTKDSCESKSLYSDYATNHVQPEYTVSLTLSQKLLGERLTLGGRANHAGPRAIGHGDVTGQGLMQFIAPIRWKPHTLVDVFAEYRISDRITASVRTENLFDIFYVDPLGLVTQPGPGRTFHASLTGTFGSGGREGGAPEPIFSGSGRDDWTGAYAGFHAGYGHGRFRGTSGVLVPGTPTAELIAATESADVAFDTPVIGLQAGYNRQFAGGFVVGFEADVSKIRSRALQTSMMEEAWLQDRNDFAGVQAQNNHYLDWMATLRARAGVAVGRHWLLYATGGAAFTNEKLVRDQYRYENDGYANGYLATRPYRVETVSATRLGYTLGAGSEYAVNERFSIKAEYAYSNFGRKDFMFRDARSGTGTDWQTRAIVGYEQMPPPLLPDHPFCEIAPSLCEPYEIPIYETTNHPGTSSLANGRRASNRLEIHAIKIGLNYRF
ncbi:TonB-dependent receptor [Sandaracinobacter sp. RS1-74]|uniref:TonB-dependent receptor domain-containing protein n=1 Tax=Sandaracinobacteroides sayramensis TaxID=2913411 RepID=UPI001EDB54D1|nr:TonB-dependent receptor [Sandaracinobacteroides sayramensis]